LNLHHITTAEYVNLVGYNCSLYPGVGPLSSNRLSNISAREISRGFIKGG
jgi:hypothetical protein